MPKPKKTPKPKTAKASAKSLATPAAPEDNGEKLIDHITALRKGLMHIFLAIVVLFPVGYWLAPQCIDFLVMWCFPPELGTLNYFSPMEVFVTRLKMGAIFAVILGYPYIIRQVWEFVLPALYDKERKALGLFIFWSALLFFIGVAFCAAFILPLVMKFSAGFATESLKPMLRLNDFLVLCGGLTLAFGLMFQFPLVMFLAVHFGLVSVETLKDKRPYVAIMVLVAAALLTPPDIVSQFSLALPTYLLFEASLFLAGIYKKS